MFLSWYYVTTIQKTYLVKEGNFSEYLNYNTEENKCLQLHAVFPHLFSFLQKKPQNTQTPESSLSPLPPFPKDLF